MEVFKLTILKDGSLKTIFECEFDEVVKRVEQELGIEVDQPRLYDDIVTLGKPALIGSTNHCVNIECVQADEHSEMELNHSDIERCDMITTLESLATRKQESIKGTTSSHLDVTMKISNTLTKREQFAMVAMQGYLSGTFAFSHSDCDPSARPSAEEFATESVSFADALIKELDK